MKKFLKFVGELKGWVCLSFTAMLLIYMFIDMVVPLSRSPGTEIMNFWWHLNNDRIRYRLILQMLLLCICISLLQYIFFSGRVMKKQSYILRMVIFGVLCLGVCVGFSIVCHWFYLDSLVQWGKFLLIFLLGFVGISLGYEIYFRALGKKYDEALGRQKRDKTQKR